MSLYDRVLQASAGRDRVVDATKAAALFLVVVGHALAWTTSAPGVVVSTLEVAPGLFWLSWVLQVLPLFFLMAGAGLVRFAANPSTSGVLVRVNRLVAPAVPLFIAALVAAAVAGVFAPDAVAQAAGLLPIQLTWFIGVYLVVVAVSPLLLRVQRAWHFGAFLGAVALVDGARIFVSEQLGWVNLPLVWAFFTALGMSLVRLRTLPRWVCAGGAVASLSAAVLVVWTGPYSVALVSTPALPGLSNLAPPSLVLAFAGLAQVFVLLLLWDGVARLLSRDWVWVVVAVFASRAMGVYVFHMVFLTVAVGAVTVSGLAPPPLGVGWWLLHIAVFAFVAGSVWVCALPLLACADWSVSWLARGVPLAVVGWCGRRSTQAASALAIATGVSVLLMSESGVSEAVSFRWVVGMPYVPVVCVAFVCIASGLARAVGGDAQGRAAAGSGPDVR